MGDLEPAKRRVPDGWRATGVVGLGWLIFRLAAAVPIWRAGWDGVLHGSVHDAVHYAHFMLVSAPTFFLLVASTLAIPLTMLGRMVVRARARAGLGDAALAAKAWEAAHPRAVRAFLAAPALAWLTFIVRAPIRAALWEQAHGLLTLTPVYVAVMIATTCVAALLALGVRRLGGAGLRMALAPLPILESNGGRDVSDRREFDAVAVTPEARLAIGVMALLPVLAVLAIQLGNLHGAAAGGVLGTYVAAAAWGAYAFRRASRVTIGVDGVFVTGSSRTRFIAYKALDEARATKTDLELCLRGKTVLRLQLHGEDARHREAILARLREAIASAKAGYGDSVGHVLATASDTDLARLAGSAGDYRDAALTREQLWAVVEGSEHDAATRAQAARALATTGKGEDMARLRVAADDCAEPRIRVLLKDLALDEDDDEEAGTGQRPLRAEGTLRGQT